jgi:hypothetical protein
VDLGLEVVEVVQLGPLGDDQAGDAGQQIVDVVVTPELAVGDDVDPRPLLVLQRRLDGHVVDGFEIGGADPALVVVVLQPFEPLGHRVGPHHGGGQQGAH